MGEGIYLFFLIIDHPFVNYILIFKTIQNWYIYTNKCFFRIFKINIVQKVLN